MSTVDKIEQIRIAANFRSILNDLKRRPEDAARELGYSPEVINQILIGERHLSQDIIEKATSVWPVSPRDFYLLKNDCQGGVRIMRAEDSEMSRRIMKRAGLDYYEYRDTAMSSVASFRPEWIQELCIVDDNHPDNPAVQWNNGHFLHQFTYFVGPVNFYYRGPDGQKKVAVMNTGDSMYITPFVPHSFATRRSEEGTLGVILALTYGNKLGGEPQQELSLLGAQQAESIVLDFSSRSHAFGSLLQFHRDGLCLSREELGRMAELPLSEIELFEGGAKFPSIEIAQRLAKSLRVNLRDLLPPDQFEDAVLVQLYSESRKWSYPNETEANYEIVELCSSQKLSSSKALELTILKNNSDLRYDLQSGLHQYIYNLGPETVILNWNDGDTSYSEELGPNDSLYMRPGIPHCFRGVGGRLLVLRIGGRIGGEVLHELSFIGKANLPRIMSESIQWYNPNGRQRIT